MDNIFWDVTPCSLAHVYQCCEATSCNKCQGSIKKERSILCVDVNTEGRGRNRNGTRKINKTGERGKGMGEIDIK